MKELPRYNDFFIHVLRSLEDGCEKKIRDITQEVIDACAIPDELVSLRLPSGRQRIVDNRIAWARTYLGKAGFVIRVSRGVYRISENGKKLLDANPSIIRLEDLNETDDFKQWISPDSVDNAGDDEIQVSDDSLTPEELLEQNHALIRSQLENDVLDRVKNLSPTGFEQLVLRVLLGMGYGESMSDVQGVKPGADGGVDGVVNQDKLGLDRVYVQAKKWDAPVGRPILQGFVGALAMKGASKGVIITTGKFAKPAIEYADQLTDRRIILVDGNRLSSLMCRFDVGVSLKQSYYVKQLDEDFFGEIDV